MDEAAMDAGRALHAPELTPNRANWAALTPLVFLKRTAEVYPERTAVIHGPLRRTWAETAARCRRLASALTRRGVRPGDTVAAMLPNTPAMLECHFGVPMTGAVLNAINTRLDAATVAFILNHGEARVLIADVEYADTVRTALAELGRDDLLVIDELDLAGDGPRNGGLTYEDFLAEGDPEHPWAVPSDEWQAIALNYTSGTTGDPKGVVYHHRGAALLALGNVMTWDMTADETSGPFPPPPVYLWTLPMFHCNGWCFPWTITALAGTHVCLRRVEAGAIYRAIAEAGVTHLCGAPIVMQLLLGASDEERRELPGTVQFMTAAAPPPASVLQSMQEAGFRVTHVYGLTEVYGPAVVCDWNEAWDALPMEQRAELQSRQGVRYPVLEDLMVADPDTLVPVRRDGATIGEVMMRGNVVMKGYLKNPRSTEAALKGGWFHTGDLGVWHPDGYIELKDRSKDIIISGGENISSIEVEGALYKHPAVAAVAVVAKPDEKWGETPLAFVELKPGKVASDADLIAHARQHLAHFKAPKAVIFGPLPKTSTGKIQKYLLREQAKGM